MTMQKSAISNIYEFIVQKCEINGLKIDEMRKEAGISHQVFYYWKKSDPYTIKQVKKLLDTIDRHADKNRQEHANDKPLFAGCKIRTYSGIYINVFDPKPEMFRIEDIARGLSRKARFGGHTKTFISVAEHSWNVADMCSENNKKAALLHDASEAYLSDMPSPIKALLPDYKNLENNVMTCIAERFGFAWPLDDEIKEADRYQLDREWNELVLSDGLAVSSAEAEATFLANYEIIFS